jgi:signal peptidase I
MQNTISGGDNLFVNKFVMVSHKVAALDSAYAQINRGDVIVFKPVIRR